jgi:hypothetical protein
MGLRVYDRALAESAALFWLRLQLVEVLEEEELPAKELAVGLALWHDIMGLGLPVSLGTKYAHWKALGGSLLNLKA